MEGKVMNTMQPAIPLDGGEWRLFKDTAKRAGISPAEASQAFVHAFNLEGGFPRRVTTAAQDPQPFASEKEALDLSTAMAEKMLAEEEKDEARKRKPSDLQEI